MFKVNNKDIRMTSMRFYQKFSIFGSCYTFQQKFMTDIDIFFIFKYCSGWFPYVAVFSDIFDKIIYKELGKDMR